MSKKIFPLIAAFGMGIAAMGCHAEMKAGTTEPKAAPPPPPAPTPEPPPPPPPAPKKEIKTSGKAKIENNEIKIPGKVHFATDKATIDLKDKETLEILTTVADVLKENAQINKLNVMGHTDDQGAHDHNVKLSQDRAAAVVDWLAAKGIDKSRLVANGYGPDRPVAKNDNAANREQNRRVEFKLWEVDGAATDAQKNDAANAAATTAAVNAGKTATPAAATKK